MIEDQIRTLFFQEVVQVVVAKAVTAMPFLGFPVIGWFFGAGVNWLARKFWDEASLMGAFMKIEFEEAHKAREYKKAETNLRIVLENPIDEEDKEKAKDEYREKLRDLIRIDLPGAA